MPNLTKKEKEAKKLKIQERKAKKDKQQRRLEEAKKLAGEPEKGALAKSSPPLLDSFEEDPWSGLTERQVTIQRLKMRGMSQSAIANVLGISQPMVFKELKTIKKVHQDRGVTLDKEAMVGQTVSVYEEVEQRAWELFSTAPDDSPLRSQALSTVMQARDKQIKLMTDLGLIEKAAHKVDHTHQLQQSPLLQNWDTHGREKLAGNILTSQLSDLDEPEPPEYEEAEIIEEKEDQ